MICANLLKRSRKHQIVFYCKKRKSYIDYRVDCKNCLDFNFKRNKPIIKRTTKQNKLEKERDKDLTKTGYCGYCGKYCGKLDPHEVYRTAVIEKEVYKMALLYYYVGNATKMKKYYKN